jgi:cytochrome c-type biogenesis protein CcmH/NrfG
VQPNLAEGHFRLGDALMGQGKFDEAVAAYRQAISIKPDFAKAYSNLGDALMGQGKFDEAIAAYRQAIGIRPDLAEAHSNLGNAPGDRHQARLRWGPFQPRARTD